ncbi:MAG: hypothetical protein KDB61_09685 [Planctomycetes bacterium]|nr:hypothetical protein [Planctomycetota bacterium]
MSTPQKNLERFAAILQATYERIDWHRLGQEYCFEGGESFFTDESIDAIQDAGLHIASDMEARLRTLPTLDSLYVGPGVAELVMMLFESLLIGRRVRAVTLPGIEPDEVNRVWSGLGKEFRIQLPKFETKPLQFAQDPTVSHLWFASVLTDPEAFHRPARPLVQAANTRLAVGGGNLTKETRRAEALVQTALTWITAPALLTTSLEELPFFQEAVGGMGLRLKVPEQGRLSPIVGDSIFHCTLRRD